MPQPTEDATSLFVDLLDDRTCEAARVPAEYCLEHSDESQCFAEAITAGRAAENPW